jgi:hypothetical protein
MTGANNRVVEVPLNPQLLPSERREPLYVGQDSHRKARRFRAFSHEFVCCYKTWRVAVNRRL